MLPPVAYSRPESAAPTSTGAPRQSPTRYRARRGIASNVKSVVDREREQLAYRIAMSSTKRHISAVACGVLPITSDT
jgi:hypothetical protein